MKQWNTVARGVAFAIGSVLPLGMTACAPPPQPATLAQAPVASRSDVPDQAAEAAIAELIAKPPATASRSAAVRTSTGKNDV